MIIIKKNNLKKCGLEVVNEKELPKCDRIWIAKDILLWIYKNDYIIKVNYHNGFNIVLRIIDLDNFYKSITDTTNVYVYHPKSKYGSFKFLISDSKISINGNYLGDDMVDAQQLLIKLTPDLKQIECTLDKL